MTLTYRLSALALASFGALTLSACQDEPERTPEDFVSDDPTAGDGDSVGEEGAGESGDSGDEGGDPGDGDGDNGDGDVEITEADIVQMEGDRLYALSAYSGLTVVDMTNPDKLRALGTWETDAEPFEMYVESGQAFVMFNDYYTWEWDEGGDGWYSYSSSRLVALDATDPGNIAVKGEFILPGRIQDSRRVGDVLYLVSMQDGYCWGCDEQQKTVVTSLDISNEANPVLIDQLAFTAPDDTWDWQRSVESTTERMYVAARSWNWDGQGSFIDVVDISAGDGTLVAGAQVQVAGSIDSRWQMNEHEGVLRTISQFGWGADDPLIETFTVESAQSIVPLGTGSLTLPMPESLRSVRFDGDRAYAITAEQTDPLFTIDLSDPANPQQVGELEIPGWVYHMETRGDRVLALGFDPANEQGSINVSLFDVSVFNAPTLRRRVHFGGDWASFAEDQNRIHKAFTILDDEEMLLVPHYGWEYGDGIECSGSYRSGVQIIDWKDDDLTLRGTVPSRGRPRRAFTHRERIVTVSDTQLATFDYADRDAPMTRDQLALAVQVDNLIDGGAVWVRMARDWYTNSQVLEIVSADDPTSPEPLGVINLGDTDACSYTWIDRLFAVGDHVFVVQSVESWDEEYNYYSTAQVIAVDISNPAAPVVVDTFDVPGQRGWGVGDLANVSTQSSWAAQLDDKLVVLTQEEGSDTAQVHVLDLSDPSNIQLAGTLERPEGQTQGQLSVLSDMVVSWHTEPVENEPGKVRFYFDRLDLSGEPQWEAKINVPGIIVAYDAEAGRAFTVDFKVSVAEELTPSECFDNPKAWQFDWDENYESGTCKLIERTLKQLEIDGANAYLVDTFDIEGNAGLRQLYATDSRIFAKADASQWIYEDEYGEYIADSRLVVVDISSNDASVHQLDGDEFGDWWWITAVQGERAVMNLDYASVGLVDASEPAQTEVKASKLPRWSGCYNPVLDGDTVYCPMGMYGLGTVEW